MKRCISKNIFHWMGWTVEGRYPKNLPKKILIVAPHTSSIDLPIGLLVKFWLNIHANFYVKAELFRGFKGWFLKRLGALPVDRTSRNQLVRQAVKDFSIRKEHIMLITPEGTRNRVDKFRSGFYYIAKEACVPIIPIAFDYGRKVIKIFPAYYVKGEGQKEIDRIRSYFIGIQGRIPEFSIF